MMRLLAVWVLSCVACGSDERPKTEPEPEPEPIEAPQPEPVAESDFDARAEQELAAQAYRAFTKAYNDGDRDAYFGAMGESLECFYDRRNVLRAEVERRRWRDQRGLVVVGRLDALRQRAGEVVFRDRGVWLREPGGRQVIHEKVVVMRLVDGAWTVVAETNRDELGCLGEVDAGSVSEELTACRASHTRCLGACDSSTCRNGCLTDAMHCVGVGHPPTPPDTSINNPDDARRFVANSLVEQAFIHSGGGSVDYEGDASFEEDSRWLSGARLRSRALLARRAGDGEPSVSCGLLPIPYPVMRELDVPDFTVGVARCEQDRCVVPFEVDDAHYALQLVFDDDDLRVMELHGPQDAAFDMDAELARYASSKPTAWESACQPTVLALAEDRVGEDFFSVECWLEPSEEGDPPNDYVITRLCGDDARRAVVALGDEWLCGDDGCGPAYTCGNGCADLSVDEGRVLSHASGIIPTMAVTPEIAERIRPMMQCGEVRGFGYEWLRGNED